MTIPHGWAPNPNYPGYYYNTMNPHEPQKQAHEFAPAPTPAYPSTGGWPAGTVTSIAAASPPPHYGAPSAGHVLPASPAGATYGTVDKSAYEQEHTRLNANKGSDVLWLDFPGKLAKKGDESIILFRALPPLRPTDRVAHVTGARHDRMYAEFNPKAKGKQWIYPNCYNAPGAPGNCPICAALELMLTSDNSDASKAADGWVASERCYWQGLDLNDLQKHYVQVTDAAGQPVYDPATGQPQWMLIPGVVTAKKKLHRAMVAQMRSGDFTHPDFGYAIRLIKTKTGPDDMNVDYDARADMAGPTPLAPELRSVLGNLIDLREECVRQLPRADMEIIAENMLAKFGVSRTKSVAMSSPYGAPAAPPMGYGAPPPAAAPPPPPGGAWIPHPDPRWVGYEINTVTSATRAAQPAMPPPPPAPAPAAYGPPPGYGAPPPPPMAAPPAPPTYGPPPGMPAMPPAAPPMAPPMGAPVAPPPPAYAPPPPMAAPPPPPPPMGPPGGGYAPPPPPPMQRPLPPPGAPGGVPGMPIGVAPAELPPPPPPPGMPGVPAGVSAMEAALRGQQQPGLPGVGGPPPPPPGMPPMPGGPPPF